MRFLLFLALFFCSCQSAILAVEEASEHNLAMANSLLGAQNACNAPSRAPSEGDIFSVADIGAVTAMPQVDGVTTDTPSPAILWEWSASYPSKASFPIESDACPDGELEYYLPAALELSDASLRYSFGNRTDEVLLSGSGPNPVLLDLDKNSLGNGDCAVPYANLTVEVKGTVSVRYSYRKSWYEHVCHELAGGIGCGCESEYEFGVKTFRKSLKNRRIFLVETGPDEIVWLNPPLASRLDGDGTGRLLYFARRMPSNVSLFFRGEKIGFAEPYSFFVTAGACGERLVGRAFSPIAKQAEIRLGNESVEPYQLVGKDAGYYPFYIEFPWKAVAGKGEFVLEIEDCFSNRESFSRNFSVRAPAPYSPDGNGKAMEIRQASESMTSAAYAGTAAKDGATPDYSALALLLAVPLAAGAHSLLRRWGS